MKSLYIIINSYYNFILSEPVQKCFRHIKADAEEKNFFYKINKIMAFSNLKDFQVLISTE